MATEPALTFSLASVVEEVLQQHASRLDANSASRKTEETCIYNNPFSPSFVINSKQIIFFCVCVCVCTGHSLLILFFLAKKDVVFNFQPINESCFVENFILLASIKDLDCSYNDCNGKKNLYIYFV